jgi:hypothetical protein
MGLILFTARFIDKEFRIAFKSIYSMQLKSKTRVQQTFRLSTRQSSENSCAYFTIFESLHMKVNNK